jgi:hypothetical protein
MAVQSFPDGSTAIWGERNYIGTLWPKTITPGASWQWHTVQFSSDPAGDEADYEETFNVTVNDAGREVLILPQTQV